MSTNQPSGRLPQLVNIDNNQRHNISSSSFTLGRAPENDLILEDDGYASATHARVYFDQGRWWVEDMMSSNGTCVNDQLISEPWQLSPNDVIKVGRTLFRVE